MAEEAGKDAQTLDAKSPGEEGAPALEDEGDSPPADESQPTSSSAPVTPSEDTGVEATNLKNPPTRNPSNTSAIPNPLPSIEECLFGLPRDLDKTTDDNAEDEDSFYIVPLNILRRVSSQGIDDDDENSGSHRGLTWRLLLGFLPADRRQWDAVAAEQRQSYHTFVQELFCLEDRDVDGSRLRGHHSKRHSDKGMTKAERRERRKQKKKEAEEGKESMPRSPIKFVDGPKSPEETHGSAPHVSEDEHDSEEDDDETSEETGKKNMDASIHQLLKDDPAQWNMSVREQKILERLTNFEAVNQLLVKRDCKEWNNFLENATLLDEIRKDVNRTHPHLYFYLEPQDRLGARRYAALERILFVWAKLNKGVSLWVEASPVMAAIC
jgi:hypothetical protein